MRPRKTLAGRGRKLRQLNAPDKKRRKTLVVSVRRQKKLPDSPLKQLPKPKRND